MSVLKTPPIQCDACEAIKMPGASGWLEYWVVMCTNGSLHTLTINGTDLDKNLEWDRRDACGQRCMVIDFARLMGFSEPPQCDLSEGGAE